MSGATPAGFFTQGLDAQEFDLPHPRIALPVILVVHRVFLQAFDLLRKRKPSLAGELEDEITADLEGIIENDLRQKNGDPAKGGVPGFDRNSFEAVTRHQCVINHDGTKLKKEPDLCFKLRADADARVLATQFALFIECKPVDAGHAAGSAYCDDGLKRFVTGDYAWAMRDAMMVAYVRDSRTIAKNLLPAMQKPSRRETLKTVILPQALGHPGARVTPYAEALHRSRHARMFRLPAGKGPAVEITIYHSWHSAA
jgi:hypothetical protein